MDNVMIRRATSADIDEIRNVADVVFRKTYASILNDAQMEYMLDWMYSAASLESQINDRGRNFFVLLKDDAIIGYVSVDEDGTTEQGRPLFHLQKIYVLPSFQGCGYGRKLFMHIMDFVRDQAPEGCRVELNVNRNNVAVSFYEKMGMTRDRQGDFPIGGGFYMNDYIYAIDLAA